ncbi:hypothetical protein VNO77_06846 [Canavalia gladiata]|uniref:Uncharacterized protein n=1 Tax=Canavalia gladiata TaxID=3824 RepID=A0AAN9QWB2_CANGL
MALNGNHYLFTSSVTFKSYVIMKHKYYIFQTNCIPVLTMIDWKISLYENNTNNLKATNKFGVLANDLPKVGIFIVGMCMASAPCMGLLYLSLKSWLEQVYLPNQTHKEGT